MQVLAVAMPYYFSYTKSSRAAQSEQEEQCLCGDIRQHNSYKFSFLRKKQMYFLFGFGLLLFVLLRVFGAFTERKVVRSHRIDYNTTSSAWEFA